MADKFTEEREAALAHIKEVGCHNIMGRLNELDDWSETRIAHEAVIEATRAQAAFCKGGSLEDVRFLSAMLREQDRTNPTQFEEDLRVETIVSLRLATGHVKALRKSIDELLDQTRAGEATRLLTSIVELFNADQRDIADVVRLRLRIANMLVREVNNQRGKDPWGVDLDGLTSPADSGKDDGISDLRKDARGRKRRKK